MPLANEPTGGDVARGVVGAVCTLIVLALLYEPTVRLVAPKLLFFALIALLSVATARSKKGVFMGIVAIVVLRLVLGSVLHSSS
jgi:hypothetical protein